MKPARLLFLSLFVALTLGLAGNAVAGFNAIGYLISQGSTLFRGGNTYTESVDMVFDVASGGALSLGTAAGSVRVQTWGKEQVRLVITKTVYGSNPSRAQSLLEMFHIRAKHLGRNLALKGEADTRECENEVGVTFSLWVPRSYNVDIKTRRGSIDIGKLNGSFNAYTSDGKITFECDPEAVDIEVEDKTAGDDEPETSPVDYNTGNEPDSRHGRV